MGLPALPGLGEQTDRRSTYAVPGRGQKGQGMGERESAGKTPDQLPALRPWASCRPLQTSVSPPVWQGWCLPSPQALTEPQDTVETNMPHTGQGAQ